MSAPWDGWRYERREERQPVGSTVLIRPDDTLRQPGSTVLVRPDDTLRQPGSTVLRRPDDGFRQPGSTVVIRPDDDSRQSGSTVVRVHSDNTASARSSTMHLPPSESLVMPSSRRRYDEAERARSSDRRYDEASFRRYSDWRDEPADRPRSSDRRYEAAERTYMPFDQRGRDIPQHYRRDRSVTRYDELEAGRSSYAAYQRALEGHSERRNYPYDDTGKSQGRADYDAGRARESSLERSSQYRLIDLPNHLYQQVLHLSADAHKLATTATGGSARQWMGLQFSAADLMRSVDDCRRRGEGTPGQHEQMEQHLKPIIYRSRHSYSGPVESGQVPRKEQYVVTRDGNGGYLGLEKR